MKNTVTYIIEAVLDCLGINYRALPCGKEALYYCKVPFNGYTFDLQCCDDDIIRLWRFVGTVPISNAGKRYEYRTPSDSHTAIGVEVTDEGDVSFYAQQKIDVNASDWETRIRKMISGYANLITDTSLARCFL